MHLLAAACEGDLETLQKLLESGTSPDDTDYAGHTALHGAAWYGRLDVMQLLLASGANHSIPRQRDGSTPVHEAAFQGHTEAIRLLLAAGASPNAATTAGQTPLHLAARQGHADAARLLLTAGASPHRVTVGGFTPLHLAAQKGHVGAVKALLEAGASPRGMAIAGQALMHMAAHQGHVQAIKLMLAAGASPNSETPDGQTPLMLAAQQGHLEAVEALIAACCDVSATDHDGDTALHALAKGFEQDENTDSSNIPTETSTAARRTAVAKALLSAGASATAVNHKGNTPLDCAVDSGALELQRLLREAIAGGKKSAGCDDTRPAPAPMRTPANPQWHPKLLELSSSPTQVCTPPAEPATVSSNSRRLVGRQRRRQLPATAAGRGDVGEGSEENARREGAALAAAEELIREEEAQKAQHGASSGGSNRPAKLPGKRGRNKAQQAQQGLRRLREPTPVPSLSRAPSLNPLPLETEAEPERNGSPLLELAGCAGSGEGPAEGGVGVPGLRSSPAQPSTPPLGENWGSLQGALAAGAATRGCEGADMVSPASTEGSLESLQEGEGSEGYDSLFVLGTPATPDAGEEAPAQEGESENEEEAGDAEFLRSLLMQLGIGGSHVSPRGQATPVGAPSPTAAGANTVDSSVSAFSPDPSITLTPPAAGLSNRSGVLGRSTSQAPVLPPHQHKASKVATSGCKAVAAAPEQHVTAGVACNDDDCCVVCMEGAKDVVLLPCKHLALCTLCAGGMFGPLGRQRTCPMCRQEVVDYIQVYKA